MDMEEMAAHADKAVQLLKALSNRSRLIVLCSLVDGEMSVGELKEKIPLSQSALSQHLAVLRRDELVTTRRDGQVIYYTLLDNNAARLVTLLHDMYCAPEE